MHAKIFIVIGIISTLFGCRNQSSSSDLQAKGDSKYHSIMQLPDGIEVIHTPDRVYAKEGGRSGYRYTWLHKTSVKSTVGDLTIVEFGAFIQDRGKWIFKTYTGKPFTPEDFAEWYSSSNATLVDGLSYTDPKNWTGAEVFFDSHTLWYFIAENSSGERFKGIGRVETVAKIKSEQVVAPDGE